MKSTVLILLVLSVSVTLMALGITGPLYLTIVFKYIIIIIIINLTLIKPEAMQVSYLSLKLRKTLLYTFVQSKTKNLKLLSI
jgi:hypothetical protein